MAEGMKCKCALVACPPAPKAWDGGRGQGSRESSSCRGINHVLSAPKDKGTKLSGGGEGRYGCKTGHVYGG